VIGALKTCHEVQTADVLVFYTAQHKTSSLFYLKNPSSPKQIVSTPI